MKKFRDNVNLPCQALQLFQKVIGVVAIVLLVVYIVPNTINNLYINPKANYWFIIDLFNIYVALIVEVLLGLTYLFFSLLKRSLSRELELNTLKSNCAIFVKFN